MNYLLEEHQRSLTGPIIWESEASCPKLSLDVDGNRVYARFQLGEIKAKTRHTKPHEQEIK
jgi:hypothetical protein